MQCATLGRFPLARLAPVTLATMVAATAVTTTACSSRAPRVAAPVEISIPPMGGAAASSTTGASVTQREPCHAVLQAEEIDTAGKQCVLDEQVSQSTGVLDYPCNGDGPATATFAEHKFEGTLSQGRLELTLRTEVDWDDGCHWETRQSVVGERPLEELTWGYNERPLSGTACLGACQASATIRVRPGANRGSPHRSNEPGE